MPSPSFDFRMENLASGAPTGALPPDVFAEASMPIEPRLIVALESARSPGHPSAAPLR